MMREFSDSYLDLLTGEYSGINLTRIEDAESFFQKQIIDSVKPIDESPVFFESLKRNKKMVDIGFGGGFPILPMAFKYPEYNFIGFEARGKKAKVVSEIAKKLKLNNVKLYHERLENILFDKPVTVTLKAVGKVENFLSMINANEKIQVFFYKGPNFHELEDLSKIKRNWSKIEEREIVIPGTEGRLLVGFENKNVLRGTNKSNKDLVIVSELF